MLNKKAKTGNFLVYIGNKYDLDKRFLDFIKKSKYFPLVMAAGAPHEKQIRPTCFSLCSKSVGRICNRPLHYTRQVAFRSDHKSGKEVGF